MMTAGLAGCGSGETDVERPEQPSASSSTPETSDSETDRMDIQIRIDEQTFEATLTDSAAARDLLAQLPASIEMSDHGGVEKTGPLASSLSLDGQPEGADPDVGDVGYYAPGNDLVLYYGDQSYYPGIVILGRMSGDAAARIAELDGSITAVIKSTSS